MDGPEGMMSGMASSPIFIHSLFRSGSTWLFDRFRRAKGASYWCYQEPFHEFLSHLKRDPGKLLDVHGDLVAAMRHPPIDRPYFYEFHAIRDQIRDLFTPCLSFESFFDTTVCPSLDNYVHALIVGAQSRPLLQCCRSWGRMRHLRDVHGGLHIHLWRNPWDQWWSYQVVEYFETSNLFILNAKNPPAVIAALGEVVGFERKRAAGLYRDPEHMGRGALGARDRYRLFYTFWLYSFLEVRPLADCDVNIDALTGMPGYREHVGRQWDALGIRNVDLSGCKVPQGVYGREERDFFLSVEEEVHEVFRRAGYAQGAIADAQRVRDAHWPRGQDDAESLKAMATRARTVALRLMDEMAQGSAG